MYPPYWRTAVQLTLLTVFAALTNSPALLLGFVLISSLLHLNVNAWESVHSGVVAGAIGGMVVVIHGMSNGYTAVEWVTGSGEILTFTVVGVVMALATVLTEWKGHPVQWVLITSGLREPEPSIKLDRHPYRKTGSHRGRKSSQKQSKSSSWTSGSGSNPSSSKPSGSETSSKQKSSSNKLEHSIELSEKSKKRRSKKSAADENGDTDVIQGANLGDSETDESPTDGDENDSPLDNPNMASDEEEDDQSVEEFMFPWEESPELRFADIGGYHDTKEELTSQVINPLQSDNESYRRFDVEPARGLLFHGPPGTGKTLFARALANALDRPFVELSQADLTHEHINKSPQLIKQLFAEAQQIGGVVFIDEAEQLLGDRSSARNAHAEDQKVTNMFLSALTKEEQDFLILLTTNQRDGMDEAILRPGRVDSEFEIGLPDLDARKEIIELTVLEVPHNLNQKHIDHLAEKTSGWSGAELTALSNQAKLVAAERTASRLKWADVKQAYREVAANRTEA
ncbi:ATP-binding protein (plasmid) [Haloferax larsenii]|uniref:ATP-binding protein n=2 Tax=Haloferax larsenii TaxID=302484 RepID=A0ABY5RJB1_HALLR|nr:ATP-binding protein [Haloferax larsenii]